jgi:digeranylgeranylglycerophospholipid reductase
MKTQRFDLAVIGSGPAGSRTAACVARSGYRVLVLEKRERIGFPVRCAEAVGPREDVERFLPLDQSLISSPINGFIVVSPDGTRFKAEMPGIGFIIDRELFDLRLAEIAARDGAEIRTGHQAVSLLRDGRRISGVKVVDIDTSTEYEVETSVVVGADGIEALSPRWAGLKNSFDPGEIFSCAQELVDGIEPSGSLMEFHLGRSYAPGGYAWVFPKGVGKANVGVGINPLKANGIRAVDYLDKFIGHRCPGISRMRLTIGGCAVARGLPSLATDGFLTVGEAAHQNNPFSGGGIINALEGAEIAAGVIVKSLQRGDVSGKSLGAYTKKWKKSVGKTNEAFYHVARIFYDLPDKKMNQVIKRAFHVPGIFDEGGVKPGKMLLRLMAGHPSLLLRFVRSLMGR